MLKAGDKVTVGVVEPVHGWGYVAEGEVGVVKGVDAFGTIEVNFPSQPGWLAEASDLKKLTRKSPEKVLAYAVLRQGELHKVVYDRDVARSTKAKLGGKSAGATIVVLQAGKEIR
ncbi:hypothetical protein [Pseudomonas sp. P8_250]|uniref:hypothetical protein n=1 Tax=Pseudomonas sp. P8_250 TaxID=3043446 RepID=UPI002A36051E|nr:hypothetical protein [Pseudomonas sp. P8_250]MDX9668685.1 hypothetical protein [Pseudomonas sp. P8_250]